jgi:hypothetical protein
VSSSESSSESDPQGGSGSTHRHRRLAPAEAVDSARSAPLAIAQPAPEAGIRPESALHGIEPAATTDSTG